MKYRISRHHAVAVALQAFVWGALLSSTAGAQSIIEEWGSVEPPPPPVLARVSVDTASTALLVLDLARQTCDPQHRPRCVAMLPKVGKLLAWARSRGVMVVYTLGAASSPADIWPEVAMLGSEALVKASPDKFVDTDLEKILKERGIKTVITVGAAAHGAVLHTAAGAAFRGFNVIVPVDGMAADTLYAEQYTAWDLVNAPRLGEKVKLTRIDMID